MGWLSHEFYYESATDLFRCARCGQRASILQTDADIDERLASCAQRTSIRDLVSAGIALLDERCGRGWPHRIDLKSPRSLADIEALGCSPYPGEFHTRDLLVEGARNLRDFFQRQGYYDTDIDFRQRPEANDEVIIEYVIARGQRYKLVDVAVEGNRYFDTETIRERMFLEPAGFIRFRHGRYSEAMRKKDATDIENLYKANGFRDVKVTSTVTGGFPNKSDVIGPGPPKFAEPSSPKVHPLGMLNSRSPRTECCPAGR